MIKNPTPIEVISERGLEALGRFYSKYRGIVLDNVDPTNMGKLSIAVPQIGIGFVAMAYPLPVEGSVQSGFKYLTPKIGQVVYVEFELGDVRHALWSYASWGKGEMPDELKDLDVLGMVTPNGHVITLNDRTGELFISIKDPQDETKEVTSIISNSEGLSIKVSDDKKVKFMEGKVGTTLTDILITKLNNLEQDMVDLKSVLGIAADAATTSLPTFAGVSTWSKTKTTSVTKQSEIENKNILQ